MIKIAHAREVNGIQLPREVINIILDAVTMLDIEYGENRDVDSGYGGYIVVIENEGDLACLQEFRIDINTAIPEYVDVVICDDGQVFASCLILHGSDFGILLVMLFSILPETVKQYLSR